MNNIFYTLGLTNPFKGLFTPMAIIIIIIIPVIIIGGKVLNGKYKTIKKQYKSKKSLILFYFILYLISGILQQMVLVVIFNIFGIMYPQGQWNIIISSMIFGLLHFPNFLLMFATTSMGIMFLNHFQLYHNLYLIGIIHGLLGNVLKFSLPENISTSFTVWLKHIIFYKKNFHHNKILKKLNFILNSYVEKNLGIILTNVSLKLPENVIVKPDIIFLDKENSIANDKKNITKIPKLIIEILSSDSIKEDRYDKFKLYEKYKVKEYWIIDPLNKTIEVFNLNLNKNKYKLSNIITGNKVLKSIEIKGFERNLNDIFVYFEIFRLNPVI